MQYGMRRKGPNLAYCCREGKSQGRHSQYRRDDDLLAVWFTNARGTAENKSMNLFIEKGHQALFEEREEVPEALTRASRMDLAKSCSRIRPAIVFGDGGVEMPRSAGPAHPKQALEGFFE